ncbi:MAG TPA: hypothetical protein VH186_11220 [Chloroflexia bacterium]|nr:hypothetical protein [Chloroflexia bacterium]
MQPYNNNPNQPPYQNQPPAQPGQYPNQPPAQPNQYPNQPPYYNQNNQPNPNYYQGNWQQPYPNNPNAVQPQGRAKKGLPAWMIVLLVVVVVGIIGGVLVAIGAVTGSVSFYTSGTLRVTDVTLAKDYKNDQAVNPTTTFSPTDNPIHAVVKLENPSADAKITGVLTAVNAGGEQNFEVARKDLALEAGKSYTANFTFSLAQDWPVGQYKFDLYLNDKLEKTVNFTVQ